MNSRNYVELNFEAEIIFGSGSAFLKMFIDGKRVTSAYIKEKGWEICFDNNGFTSWSKAKIPVDEFLKYSLVSCSYWYDPGPKGSWKMGTKKYIKRFCTSSKEKYIPSLASRLDDFTKRKWEVGGEAFEKFRKTRGFIEDNENFVITSLYLQIWAECSAVDDMAFTPDNPIPLGDEARDRVKAFAEERVACYSRLRMFPKKIELCELEDGDHAYFFDIDKRFDTSNFSAMARISI